jgi:D-aspartate ligase
VLFGGGSINALGITRNLGKNRVKVYYVDEEKNEAMFSRYCVRSFTIPGIQEDMRALGKLRNFLVNFNKEISSSAVIFPGSDLYCLALSSLKDEIVKEFHFALPSEEIVETLVNKKKFYQSLDKHMIPHPTTYFPECFDDVKRISKNVDYPVYVRPSISQIFTKRFHEKGFIAKSEKELIRYCALAARSRIDFMIQEIIPGPAMNLFGVCGYFNKNARPMGLFAYRRIREWPHKFGTNSLIESVSISDVSLISELAVNYLRSIGYHGLMEAEFKKDPRDGNFKFLEVNARSWWQNSFPTKCGINLVLMAYLDMIGGEIRNQEKYKVGVKWIYFLNDLRSVLKMLRNREITIQNWFCSLRMINDYAYFSADDPLPSMLSPFFHLVRARGTVRRHATCMHERNRIIYRRTF